MRLFSKLLASLLMILVLGGTSNASNLKHHHRHGNVSSHRLHYPDGRPSAWCGWAMRQLVPTDPGPSYNLAANWAHYGTHAEGPAVGRIAVWPHHVAMIVGYDTKSHRWITHEGNYSHAWHLGPRSLSGVMTYRNI
jgi:hypothetical protein